MASPQRTDAQSILELIKTKKLRRSTAIKNRAKSLPELIEAGIMPKWLPCDCPCPRADKLGNEYLFTCESCKKYSKPNPDYYSSYRKTRIPASIRWAIWERDNFTCRKCGARRYLTIDHIILESKGGKTETDNLQTLCKSCNSRKSKKGSLRGGEAPLEKISSPSPYRGEGDKGDRVT